MRTWPVRMSWSVGIASLLAASGCGRDSGPAFLPMTAPTTESRIASLAFSPPGVRGGASSVGTLGLTFPAPASGVTVTLASNHPTVAVPASVTVPAGSATVQFTVTTTLPGEDVQATVTAASTQATVTGALSVWATPATFFYAVGEVGDGILGVDTRRVLPGPSSQFAASCVGGRVIATVSGPGTFWNVIIEAPRGRPMSTGIYEVPANRGPDGPQLSVGGDGRGCTTGEGRFAVSEFVVAPNGSVQRLWVSFDQRCTGAPGVLRGEVRMTLPSLIGTVPACAR